MVEETVGLCGRLCCAHVLGVWRGKKVAHTPTEENRQALNHELSDSGRACP